MTSASDDGTPTLLELDRDEALGEAVAALCGDTRAEFMRRTAIGSAALLTAMAAPAQAAPKVTDAAILDFTLRFEYLQAAFYTEAERVGTVDRLSAEKQRWARVVGSHERSHVKVVRSVIGRKAPKSPFFDFRGVTETEDKFTKTAVAFEDLTVALLTGVVPRVQNRELTAAVFGLLTTEARHASWVRKLSGVTPVVDALDEPKSFSEVGRIINATNFIASRPKTSMRSKNPRFTG